ncbi:hypothetical protein KM031_08565 [Gemmobacter fulvus]|uniref:Uncharacterized protein n=1 Tax=Gemmobacter fulvus TaxID=2840474 RepID=A0A975P404_9RHOB|nr:hypothetical protein [Gemmobacter fulvus]MBT9247179.1 hypothetical protein [Gemmobacter fulvus]MDQ1849921.1 hypothetical protein [Gemmobacter fulvus]QWK88947.1 hypothetical protein KM031_08565 [Gemmobacter fulvus]
MGFQKVLTAVALVGFAGPALAADLSFTLSNMSGAELTEFYASPVGVDSWEENILGGGALAGGTSGQVTIAGSESCDYDLRMVFSDGDTLEDSANLCDTGSYTIQ